jgi:nucleotide-binding universal stress UspA family protein
MSVVSTTAGVAGVAPHARRVLVVLECRPSDDAVLTRAGEIAAASGGYLTLVVVAPRPFPFVCPGPYCAPRVSPDELRRHAAQTLARAAALVPPGVPVIAALDSGRTKDVIRRRVEVAAHDLVVVRTRGRGFAQLPVSVLAC